MGNYLRAVIFFVCLLSVVLFAAVPSIRPGVGATLYDTGATFRVWAPNATTVSVAGNFNSWNQRPLAAEGHGWWSLDVAGVNAHDQYRYVINGSIWKTDPRAKKVVSSVGNGVVVSNDYTWTPFDPPPWNEMVIYEMHIGTYNDTPGGGVGTWQSALDKLDHIENLGVNAIEIMPIAEFPGDYSLGYNPVHIFAPESAYGSPDKMREFVDECHKRGIAVLIDVVYNHFGPGDLEYSLWQFDGYSAYSDTGGIYFYEDANRHTPWGDRPNYTIDEVRSFIRDNAMYWLNDFNCDGLRVDATAYMRQRGIGEPEIPEGWTLVQWINNEIDAAHSQKICIAEDMRDDDWLTKSTVQGGAGFDSQWDAGFHHKVVPALTTTNDWERNMWDIADAITHLYNGWDTQRVIYTESHDEVGKSSGKFRVPEQIWPGNANNYYSKKRSTLGAGLVLTSPGIPMIFMGQEFFEDGSWHDDDPLDWTKDTTFAGIKLLYKDLIGLRRNLSNNTRGLTAKNTNVFHVNNTNKLIAYHRWYNGGVGDDVVVVANFSYHGFAEYNIGMPKRGRWRVRFNSDWDGYDSGYDNWNSYDANAQSGAKDGMAYNANIGIGPYSMVIFSQGTGPNLDAIGKVDLNDLVIFARNWNKACDPWNSCEGADFNIDGSVDLADLYVFISGWLAF